ncbi:MAG: fimbria/pilus outer membrane usher protein [Thiobacillus sp.]
MRWIRLEWLGIACLLGGLAHAEELVPRQERLLGIEVNLQPTSPGQLVLEDENGAFWLSADALASSRLKPAPDSRTFQSQTFYRLSALPGVGFRIDETRQLLVLTAAPDAILPGPGFSLARPPLTTTPASPGGFLNYDFFVRHGDSVRTQSAALEFGLFNRLGVGTQTLLFNEGDGFGRGIRLETRWQQDWPERLASLRLGDSVSGSASLFGGATRFAGIQYSTNFATQPQRITSPLQSVTGSAVLPSVAEVYLNDNLLLRQPVPPGQFSVTDIPTISGAGEITVVVRDLLGREQILTQPFFSSPILLAEGLADFSFEIGVERDNFGTASADYGKPLAVATYRRGLSDQFTGEFHAAALDDLSVAGIGGSGLMSRFGVLGAALAASHAQTGSGSQATLSYEYSGEPFSFSTRHQWSDSHYREIGLTGGLPARASDVFVGVQFGHWGSVSAGFIERDVRAASDQSFWTLSAQTTLRGLGNSHGIGVLLNYFQSLEGPDNQAATLAIIVPLGERTTASTQHKLTRSTETTHENYVTLQQSPPAGEGWGYRVQASDVEAHLAGVAYKNQWGSYGLEFEQRRDSDIANASVAGALAVLGGRLLPTRRIDQSFGLVDVPGFTDVRVYADNQLMGVTDTSGQLLLPDLRAYEPNSIHLDHRDLPLDSHIDNLRLNAVPTFRAGQLVRFQLARTRPAMMTLMLADGNPLPVGATITLNSTTNEQSRYHVAGKGGQVYLDNATPGAILEARYASGRCTLVIPPLPDDDPLPDLGTQLCTAISP